MKFPASVLASLFLFVAETTAALYLSSTYRSAGDRMWQALTLFFSLMPCALVQFTLLCVCVSLCMCVCVKGWSWNISGNGQLVPDRSLFRKWSTEAT